MATYNVSTTIRQNGVVLALKFGDQSSNGPKCRDAVAALANIKPGGIALLNGPASLPVACAISHEIAHIFSAVLVYDPKENHYVVAVAHNPPPGVNRFDEIPADEVEKLLGD
jgi:CRISPR-associated protein Csx3